MSKKFENQLMKFEVGDNKLKMEISLGDLKKLFHSDPNNVSDDGEGNYCTVKEGKEEEFAEKVVEYLIECNSDDSDSPRWGEPFVEIFEELASCGEGFLNYNDLED